jgi:hypothetical protein
MSEHPAVDSLVLLMVSGISRADLTAACIGKLGVPADKAARVIAQARRKLTLAADYNRDEQLGTAVTRLNDLYARAIRGADIKTAVTAQKELNRLMALYADTNRDPSDNGDAYALRRQLDLIAGHLLPLRLADAEHPIEEHARLAADVVRRALAKPEAAR